MSRKGLMICNIGTPSSYDPDNVGAYLKEFLMDEEILTLPFLFRYLLVHVGIVPRRKKVSAANYKAIWTDKGSPLLVYSEKLRSNLQQAVADSYVVEIGMRYGQPSIELAMKKFKNMDVEELTVLPLYPQYARASTESCFKKVDELNRKHNFDFKIKKIPSFYESNHFIRAVSETSRNFLTDKKVDHYLMTYHGLPLRQNARMSPEASYQQQCLRTSELIAEHLGLPRSQWTHAFQSRVGVTEWIRPYTDEVLKELAQKGVKNLAVLCPSFIADCLETIEEIGVQGQRTFLQAGGESFHLVPCLNDRADYLVSIL